jgi:hypothetical protein
MKRLSLFLAFVLFVASGAFCLKVDESSFTMEIYDSGMNEVTPPYSKAVTQDGYLKIDADIGLVNAKENQVFTLKFTFDTIDYLVGAAPDNLVSSTSCGSGIPYIQIRNNSGIFSGHEGYGNNTCILYEGTEFSTEMQIPFGSGNFLQEGKTYTLECKFAFNNAMDFCGGVNLLDVPFYEQGSTVFHTLVSFSPRNFGSFANVVAIEPGTYNYDFSSEILSAPEITNYSGRELLYSIGALWPSPARPLGITPNISSEWETGGYYCRLAEGINLCRFRIGYSGLPGYAGMLARLEGISDEGFPGFSVSIGLPTFHINLNYDEDKEAGISTETGFTAIIAKTWANIDIDLSFLSRNINFAAGDVITLVVESPSGKSEKLLVDNASVETGLSVGVCGYEEPSGEIRGVYAGVYNAEQCLAACVFCSWNNVSYVKNRTALRIEDAEKFRDDTDVTLRLYNGDCTRSACDSENLLDEYLRKVFRLRILEPVVGGNKLYVEDYYYTEESSIEIAVTIFQKGDYKVYWVPEENMEVKSKETGESGMPILLSGLDVPFDIKEGWSQTLLVDFTETGTYRMDIYSYDSATGAETHEESLTIIYGLPPDVLKTSVETAEGKDTFYTDEILGFSVKVESMTESAQETTVTVKIYDAQGIERNIASVNLPAALPSGSITKGSPYESGLLSVDILSDNLEAGSYRIYAVAEPVEGETATGNNSAEMWITIGTRPQAVAVPEMDAVLVLVCGIAAVLMIRLNERNKPEGKNKAAD